MSTKGQSTTKPKNSKLWSDDIYLWHPKMRKVIKPHLTLADSFTCIICEDCKSPYVSGQLKNVLGHYDESKSHRKNMESAGLIDINKEIVAALRAGSNGLNGVAHPEQPIRQTIHSEENGVGEHPHLNTSYGPTELKMEVAKFIVGNRLPYSLTSELMIFLKSLMNKYTSRDILQCQLSRTTVSRIASRCIAESLKDDIYTELKNSPFSLSLDETSDKFGSSFLAVCVKYVSKNNNTEPESKLLSILPVDEDKTAKALYKAVRYCILRKDTELERNFVGIVSDQAASMTGRHKGLVKRLQRNYPYIIGAHDLSHIYHLITKHSVRSFPSEIFQIIRDITNHFSNSCQRRAKFRAVQVKMEYSKALDIKNYTQVRWLSLAECLGRIMDLWEPLQIYFVKYGEEGEIELFTLENEAYLRNFLSVLELLVHYNLESQKKNLLYNDLLLNMQESLIIFAKMVIPQEQMHLPFDGLIDIPFDAEDDILLPSLISVEEFGERWISEHNDVQDLISKLNPVVKQQILKDTMKLVLKVLYEIKKRLPLSSKILLQAQTVFFTKWDSESWRALSRQFTNIIPEEDLRHFNRDLLRMEINFRKHVSDHERSGRSVLETWQSLSSSYPYMSKLAKAVLVLPSSTVPVERVFSQMQDFKTPKRNRLTVSNIESSLLIYQCYGSMQFELNDKMLSKYDQKWKELDDLKIDESDSEEEEPRMEEEEEEKEERKEEVSRSILPPQENRHQELQEQRLYGNSESHANFPQLSSLSAGYHQLASFMNHLLFSPPPPSQEIQPSNPSNQFSPGLLREIQNQNLQSSIPLTDHLIQGPDVLFRNQPIINANQNQEREGERNRQSASQEERGQEKEETNDFVDVNDKDGDEDGDKIIASFADLSFEVQDGSLKRKVHTRNGTKRVYN